MAIVKKKLKRGFTLVELMIVVAIVGVLAALAIYGVRKYLLNAKTAEARDALGRLAKDASAAFNREGMDSAVLDLENSTGIINHLCGSVTSGQVVPASMDAVKGKKYQSTPTEWSTGDDMNGWTCLKFSMEDPQYYQYGYSSTGTEGNTGDTYQAIAKGDLDGDGTASTFTINGRIQDVDGEKVVTRAPSIDEVNPEE